MGCPFVGRRASDAHGSGLVGVGGDPRPQVVRTVGACPPGRSSAPARRLSSTVGCACRCGQRYACPPVPSRKTSSGATPNGCLGRARHADRGRAFAQRGRDRVRALVFATSSTVSSSRGGASQPIGGPGDSPRCLTVRPRVAQCRPSDGTSRRFRWRGARWRPITSSWARGRWAWPSRTRSSITPTCTSRWSTVATRPAGTGWTRIRSCSCTRHRCSTAWRRPCSGMVPCSERGPEAGLQERARQSEIQAYYDDVLHRRFLGVRPGHVPRRQRVPR